MVPKVIKITPVESYFSITWTITNKCNYDCMYCPAALHAGDHVYSLSKMQSYWLDIFAKTQDKNLKYKISFTGGEVTTNKDFAPFVAWLRENYNDRIHSILLTTNGSASVAHYTKLYHSVDNISFSFHGEHADEKLFYDKMVKLKKIIDPKNFIHVNIMNEYWIKDRIPLYTKILTGHEISHSINSINYSSGTRTVPILQGRTNLEI